MTIELKKQKLQEYIETATEEEIEDMYESYLDETGPTEWSDEFTAEMEARAAEMESGKVQPIPLEQVLQNARNTLQKIRESATIHH